MVLTKDKFLKNPVINILVYTNNTIHFQYIIKLSEGNHSSIQFHQ
jgi:hypothetical protein